MEKKELIGLTPEGLAELMQSMGERPFRASQLFQALYRERCWDFGAITTMPVKLRERLQAECQATVPVIQKRYKSIDGTVRYLLRLADGKEIETVLLPEADRDTICVSTQVGCAVDCKFCLTGVMGFQRNLTPGEIVGEVLAVIKDSGIKDNGIDDDDLKDRRGSKQGDQRRLNLVFMGMGEPMLNFDNVMAAVKLFAQPKGMAIAPGRITLSTSGIVPGIEKFAAESARPKLAISLNATTDEVRSRIMPINRKWPITTLLEACSRVPLGLRERLTFEYVLLEGVNDTEADAKRLAALMRPLKAMVNLIGLNPGPELPFHTPSDERVLWFQEIVISGGVQTYIRKPRGRDIFAACGQLKLAEMEEAR